MIEYLGLYITHLATLGLGVVIGYFIQPRRVNETVEKIQEMKAPRQTFMPERPYTGGVDLLTAEQQRKIRTGESAGDEAMTETLDAVMRR